MRWVFGVACVVIFLLPGVAARSDQQPEMQGALVTANDIPLALVLALAPLLRRASPKETFNRPPPIGGRRPPCPPSS